TVLRRIGIKPEQAPGIKLYAHFPPDPEFSMEIVGVMKDFNYNSLHNEIKPFMLMYNPQYASHVTVSVSSSNYKELLSKIENTWHKNLQGVPFEFSFLD